MQIVGIGDVTSCNKAYIFLNNEGKQERIRATPELLSLIRDTASRDRVFYDRMWAEINEAYNKKKAEIEAKYHYITDEMVAEAFKRGRKEGLELSWSKDTHNEECSRQFNRLFGMYEGANLASDRKWRADKLLAQAEGALKEMK